MLQLKRLGPVDRVCADTLALAAAAAFLQQGRSVGMIRDAAFVSDKLGSQFQYDSAKWFSHQMSGICCCVQPQLLLTSIGSVDPEQQICSWNDIICRLKHGAP